MQHVIKGYKFVSVEVEFLAFNILLHTKAIIFKNSNKTRVFNKKDTVYNLCQGAFEL